MDVSRCRHCGRVIQWTQGFWVHVTTDTLWCADGLRAEPEEEE